MKYEGHFLLWYLILMPFAKLGLPYITINFISLFITAISVFLILKKCPFRFYQKVLIIFTFPLLYLYPIVARCYCLIPLAIVLMCIFYKSRKEKPFRYLLSIVILANTHVIMLGMVGLVLLNYMIELIKDWKSGSKETNKKNLIAFIITIILLIVSMLPLLTCLSTNKDLPNPNSNILSKLLYATIDYPFQLLNRLFSPISSIKTIGIMILLIISILIPIEFKHHPLDYIEIWISFFWQCLIYTFIYGVSNQRAASIIFIVLYFKWISTYDKPKDINKKEMLITKACWIILVFLNIINGLLYVYHYEINYNCSNAYEIGNYINNNIADNSIILNGPRVEFASSIIPYINKNITFYHIIRQKEFTYTIWDEINKIDIKPNDIENLINTNTFDKNQNLYYIFSTFKINIIKNDDGTDESSIISEYVDKGVFEEVYATSYNSLNSENFILYKINKDKF